MNARRCGYKRFGECLWLDNGVWEMAASLDFGPRILRFSRVGEENVFYEQPEDAAYLRTEAGWRVFGGTRLWFAPECEHPLYYPDLAPVTVTQSDGAFVVTQAEDPVLGVEKRLIIRECGDANSVAIDYRIRNTGRAAIVGAPWAVSAMRPGGVFCASFAGPGGELTARPARVLSLWNDTSLGDARLRFTGDAICVSQDPDVSAYFKIGLFSWAGKARYDIMGQTFLKRFPVFANAAYPDGGVNLEVYCCAHMLEFETLAPLRTLSPGEAAEHTEYWSILRGGTGREADA